MIFILKMCKSLFQIMLYKLNKLNWDVQKAGFGHYCLLFTLRYLFQVSWYRPSFNFMILKFEHFIFIAFASCNLSVVYYGLTWFSEKAFLFSSQGFMNQHSMMTWAKKITFWPPIYPRTTRILDLPQPLHVHPIIDWPSRYLWFLF